MKLCFYHFQSSREDWAETAIGQFSKKIDYFFPFEVQPLKSKAISRNSAESKKSEEEKKLLSVLKQDDFVILFDEQGSQIKDSRQFSKKLVHAIESGKRRVVFVIGGPYGFTDRVRDRADWLVSLSSMTMNHFVAQVVALEQIYRALTIWKGIKYHND